MDSELQIGLVALGIAAVVSIVAYNKWQERKHRRHAEQAFKSEHRDVLLEPSAGVANSEERVEPWAGDDEPLEQGSPTTTNKPAASVRPRESSARQSTPGLPDSVDSRVDCVIRIESIEPLDAPRLWAAQQEQFADLGRQVRWFAFDDGENFWRSVRADTAGAFHWYCAAMQMVDRRGAIGEADFMRFSGGIQRVADQFLAVQADSPSRAEILGGAIELDRFCASVDVQIGVNIVSNGAPFAGTKIRALAESDGMVIDGDGAFHARDEEGNTLFALSNLEPALFAADEMRTLVTNGLTLVIDVPRVPNGPAVFDRMMQQAMRMADALNGSVVDDNRSPFGADAAGMIRSQIAQFQSQMADCDLPAGSPQALRLFSA